MPAQTALTEPAAPLPRQAAPLEPTPHATPHTDAWTWVAESADGTTVAEMDGDGYDMHGMADVDVTRVVRFHLVPCQPGFLPAPTVELDLARGQRVIFTRRRRLTLDLGTGATTDRRTVHLLGYQETVNGTNVKHLTYWFEDGSCLLSSDDQAV